MHSFRYCHLNFSGQEKQFCSLHNCLFSVVQWTFMRNSRVGTTWARICGDRRWSQLCDRHVEWNCVRSKTKRQRRSHLGGCTSSKFTLSTKGLLVVMARKSEKWTFVLQDSHRPETSDTGNLHGMPVAHLLGYGAKQLKEIGDRQPKIKPSDLAFIGIRSYEVPERVSYVEDRYLEEFCVKI